MTLILQFLNILALRLEGEDRGEGGVPTTNPHPNPVLGDGKIRAIIKAANWIIPTLLNLLLFLAGCTVGPDYVRPKVEIPANYKETVGWQIAQPQDAALRGNWWELFGEPQLNAFEEQVDISNQNVAVAEAQFRQARALVQQARAAYFPMVTIGASLNNSSQSATTQ